MPLETFRIICVITIVSFDAPAAGRFSDLPECGWPEKVKGLARYVLSHSRNTSNYPALKAGSIKPSGANDSISLTNL
jgi:hypothetical protein